MIGYGNSKENSNQALYRLSGTTPEEGAYTHSKESRRRIFVDPTGKKAGRGAYICKNRQCFDKAVKEHRFARSFKCAIDQTIFDELEKQLFE